jgi:hypothetical protein
MQLESQAAEDRGRQIAAVDRQSGRAAKPAADFRLSGARQTSVDVDTGESLSGVLGYRRKALPRQGFRNPEVLARSVHKSCRERGKSRRL